MQTNQEPKQFSFSFKDYTPRIKLNRLTHKIVNVAPTVKRLIEKYKETNGAHSESHAIHMAFEEIAIQRQMLRKLNIAIKRAHKENNVNFFIRAFDDLATQQEKVYYEAIVEGFLD